MKDIYIYCKAKMKTKKAMEKSPFFNHSFILFKNVCCASHSQAWRH